MTSGIIRIRGLVRGIIGGGFWCFRSLDGCVGFEKALYR